VKVLGSVAAVIAAIQEDAAAELEAIERRTKAALDRVMTEDTDRVELPDRELRLSLARQEGRARAAHETWEDTCSRLAGREAWINKVVTLGRQRLAESTVSVEDRRAALTTLVREALDRLPGPSVEIVVSAADITMLNAGWAASVGTAAQREVRVVAGSIDGGCIVRASDGRASFDNTYVGRERRLEALWRAALVELYDRVGLA
jgi:vacuolar-type H+-ATPase subunit E/Vma4